MKAVHRMAVVAKCPKGGRDEYELEIETNGLIQVEAIIAAVEQATVEPIYQEDLCLRIIEKLEIQNDATDQEVTGVLRLRGTHSGVRTEVEEEFHA